MFPIGLHVDDTMASAVSSKTGGFADDRQTPKKTILDTNDSTLSMTKPKQRATGIVSCEYSSASTKDTQFIFGGKRYQLNEAIISATTVAQINTNYDLAKYSKSFQHESTSLDNDGPPGAIGSVLLIAEAKGRIDDEELTSEITGVDPTYGANMLMIVINFSDHLQCSQNK